MIFMRFSTWTANNQRTTIFNVMHIRRLRMTPAQQKFHWIAIVSPICTTQWDVHLNKDKRKEKKKCEAGLFCFFTLKQKQKKERNCFEYLWCWSTLSKRKKKFVRKCIKSMLFIMSQYLSCHRHWDEAKRLPKKCSWLSIQRNQQVTTTTHIIMFVDTHRMCEDDTKSAQWTCNCFTTTTKKRSNNCETWSKRRMQQLSLYKRVARTKFHFLFSLHLEN